jgi:hypothetical protein
MRILLSAIVFASFFGLRAQTKVSARLIDSKTGKPVEFANIGIPMRSLGTVSDEEGKFSLTIPDSLLDENLRFSMIGYKSRMLSGNELTTNSVVSLEPQSHTLQEITVSVPRQKIKVLGNETRSSGVTIGFKKNNLGTELAVKLNIKHPKTQIRRFMLNIVGNTLDTIPVFRLNIYKADHDGNPGENILTQNTIVSLPAKTGFMEVDLRQQNIVVDDDVFISLEWIKNLGDVSGLYFSTKLVGTGTWYRITSQDKWEKVPTIGAGLHAEVAY